jgi:hypothetical protein
MLMKRLALVIIVLLGAPAVAYAACDGIDNCLGIYFDQDTWTQTCAEPVPWTPFHVYFVLQNCAFDAIGGIDFAWRFDPTPAVPPIVLAAYLPGVEPWITDYYNIIYAIGGPPVIIEGPFVVLDLTMILVAPFTADLQLGPALPATLPGHGAINDYYDPANIVPLNYGSPVDADGWTVDGVARFGNCSTPVETTNWSTIKALFR